jgi:hypothetical protein
MTKRLRLGDKFAVLGLGVSAGLLAYSLSSFGAVVNPVVVLFLCPPAFLSGVFIDRHPTTAEVVVMWLLIGSLNAVLYGGIGAAITELWKSK